MPVLRENIPPSTITIPVGDPPRRSSWYVRAYGLWAPALALATVVYYAAAAPLLKASNAAAPKVLPGAFSFTQLVFRPEPLETPVYLSGFFVIPLAAAGLAYAAGWGMARGYLRERFIQGWPAALLLAGLGFVLYGVLVHLVWFSAWRQLPVRGILRVQGMAVFALVAALALAWRRFDLGAWLARMERWPWRWLRPALVVALAVLVFSPDFPFDHHHYHDQIGPVNDLLHGKHFLQDTGTHYGLLNTYFWYALFRYLIPLSYQATSLALMVATWAWLVGWYYLVRAWLKREAVAALVTLAMLGLWAIPGGGFDGSYGAPSSLPFHQLMVLVLAAVVWRLGRAPGAARLERAALIAAAAVSFFWFTDTGLYLALVTLGVLFSWELGRPGPFLRRLAGFLGQAGLLVAAIVALAGAYSVVQYWHSGGWPEWPLLYVALGAYRAGYMLYPLPAWGFYEVYVMVFAGTLVYLTAHVARRRPLGELALPLFLTLFGVLQLLYYVTRSYPANLASRNVFVLILLAAWWWTVLERPHACPAFIRRTLAGALGGGLVLALLFGGYVFGRTLSQRDYRNVVANFTDERLSRPEVYGGHTEVLDDLAVLRADYGTLERPAILHWHDATILLRWRKTNALPIYHLPAVLFTWEMDRVVAQVRRDGPPYLFIGRPGTPGFEAFAYYTDKIEYFRSRVLDGYTLERQLKTMDVYRRQTPQKDADDDAE